jgi:glutaminyl-tRNA synthetase
VSKVSSTVEYGFLEHCLREELNATAKRVMAVLRPVKLTLTNYPEGQTEYFEVENNPENEADGKRQVAFSRDLYIEADDFMEVPVPKYNRLYVGGEVRLKGAYIIKCTGCVKDADGNVTEILATVDMDTRGGDAPDGRKVKGTIHWVDSNTAVDAEVRLYSNLFSVADPDSADRDFIECLNPESLEVLHSCKLEQSLSGAQMGERFQFMRMGYFCLDSKDSTPDALVFNRAVALKDSWAKKK